MDGYRSNVWKFYLVATLSGFAFFYNGIETLYYRHFNLTFEQIGFLISASLIAKLLLDIPTGSFADIYGKKKSIIVASILGLIGLAFLSFGSNFNTFVLGFIFMGFAGAFSTGAASALLYDSLNL